MISALGTPLGAKAMEDVWSVSPTQGQECEDVWSGSPIQQAPWEESMHAPPPLLRAKNVRTSRTEAPIACTRYVHEFLVLGRTSGVGVWNGNGRLERGPLSGPSV